LAKDSTEATVSSPLKVSRWKAIFPPAQWVLTYEARWLRSDLLTGITLGAYALPEGVAYASLASLPPQVGIYGYLLGGVGCALFGLANLALLWLGEKFLPNRPVALLVVILSTTFISVTNLASHVATVGDIPSGFPSFGPPVIQFEEVNGILPVAFTALLLSYMESVSAGRAFASKHGYKLDVRQELLGLGSANLRVAFGDGLSGCRRPLPIRRERGSRR
jgi:MFS superfamily sulfate permease-like transporter